MQKLVDQKYLAERLGTSVSVINTLRWRGTLDIPYYKIGHKVVYDVNDIEQWLKRRKMCKKRSIKWF